MDLRREAALLLEPVLKVSQLTKTISGRQIVKDVSFEVQAGQVFGFLGPNGAGKTTTIRMLVGLIRPTAGEIVINGFNLRTDFQNALRHVGSIVENPDLYPYLTGYENLLQLARMQGQEAVGRIDEVVELVGLTSRIHDKVGSYSLGMRQRLGISQALLNKPKLLILDEPTNGLDPAGIRELRTFLQELAQQGMSIFISSHLLAEVELLCTYVAMIRDGKVVRTGSVEELLSERRGAMEWQVTPVEKAREILSQFCEESAVDVVSHGSQSWLRCFVPDSAVTSAVQSLLDEGCEVHELKRHRPTLEDVFLAATGVE